MYCNRQIHSVICKGFSLIEAAIVLSVIGLVIGGIWYAASEVSLRDRERRLASDILSISEVGRRLFSRESYPASVGGMSVTSTAYSGNAIPANYTLSGVGTRVLSPDGVALSVSLDYSGGIGPIFTISLFDDSIVAESKFTPADCRHLVKVLAARFRTNDNLYYIQVNSSGSGGGLYYPPIDASSITCPDELTTLQFRFRPY